MPPNAARVRENQLAFPMPLPPLPPSRASVVARTSFRCAPAPSEQSGQCCSARRAFWPVVGLESGQRSLRERVSVAADMVRVEYVGLSTSAVARAPACGKRKECPTPGSSTGPGGEDPGGIQSLYQPASRVPGLGALVARCAPPYNPATPSYSAGGSACIQSTWRARPASYSG